jgi:HPt (histidine-containing phosphotransfer) domain-containing protein
MMAGNEHIDRQKALGWLEGDERMLEKVKAIFTKNVPSQVATLKGVIEAGDAAAAERLAHTIMGSSAMMGATVMSEHAARIEKSAINGDMASARLQYEEFVAEYWTVMEMLSSGGGKQ